MSNIKNKVIRGRPSKKNMEMIKENVEEEEEKSNIELLIDEHIQETPISIPTPAPAPVGPTAGGGPIHRNLDHSGVADHSGFAQTGTGRGDFLSNARQVFADINARAEPKTPSKQENQYKPEPKTELMPEIVEQKSEPKSEPKRSKIPVKSVVREKEELDIGEQAPQNNIKQAATSRSGSESDESSVKQPAKLTKISKFRAITGDMLVDVELKLTGRSGNLGKKTTVEINGKPISMSQYLFSTLGIQYKDGQPFNNIRDSIHKELIRRSEVFSHNPTPPRAPRATKRKIDLSDKGNSVNTEKYRLVIEE